ncbi:MAG: hypothetical protein ACD_78C00359G0002, partial [uncultured bacterium (gcode 4)]
MFHLNLPDIIVMMFAEIRVVEYRNKEEGENGRNRESGDNRPSKPTPDGIWSDDKWSSNRSDTREHNR